MMATFFSILSTLTPRRKKQASGAAARYAKMKPMSEFLAKHSYLMVWVSELVIIGAISSLILDLNGGIPGFGGNAEPRSLPAAGGGLPAGEAAAPAGPPAVAFYIQKSAGGNSFILTWRNLPNGTAELMVFRGKTGTPTSTWGLWKTVYVGQNDLAQGIANITLGNDAEAGYSFYVQAVGQGGGSPTSTIQNDVLWQSLSETPTVTTSTQPIMPPPPSPPPQNQSPPSNPSSTPGQQPSSSAPQAGNNPSASTTPPAPSGTPYYNPQIQISSYGQTQSGSFWVHPENQGLEIGWQNLPPQTVSITVTRSLDANGPWTTLLTEQDPPTTGSYSLRVVDGSQGTPYYYEMTVSESGGVTVMYGPEYVGG